MKRADIIYAAGLFDGEGNITIVRVARGGSKEKRYHRLQLTLASTDFAILEWLKKKFGGCVGSYRAATDKWKESAAWRIADKHAERFLEAVRPYLKIKAHEADIALAFRRTMIKAGGKKGLGRRGSPRMESGVYDIREAMRLKMNASR